VGASPSAPVAATADFDAGAAGVIDQDWRYATIKEDDMTAEVPEPAGESDVFGAEKGGTDEFGPEQGGTDEFGPEKGGTDEFGPEEGGTDEFGPETGGTDVFAP
jgi:hypothetical protein